MRYEVFLRLEMAVEAAVGEACGLHYVVETDAIDATLSKEPGGSRFSAAWRRLTRIDFDPPKAQFALSILYDGRHDWGRAANIFTS